LAYLLDTNVAVHLRDGDETVTSQVAALEGAILLSTRSGFLARAALDAMRKPP
jgi:predicted nucleic acid-binding protein